MKTTGYENGICIFLNGGTPKRTLKGTLHEGLHSDEHKKKNQNPKDSFDPFFPVALFFSFPDFLSFRFSRRFFISGRKMDGIFE